VPADNRNARAKATRAAVLILTLVELRAIIAGFSTGESQGD
jgi:hypothetical protein